MYFHSLAASAPPHRTAQRPAQARLAGFQHLKSLEMPVRGCVAWRTDMDWWTWKDGGIKQEMHGNKHRQSTIWSTGAKTSTTWRSGRIQP